MQNLRTPRYFNSRCIRGVRGAVAAQYARSFDVDIDLARGIIVTLGPNKGLANLAAAITTPGHVILVPKLSYQMHQFAFIIASAAARTVPIELSPDMLDALHRAVRQRVPKSAALIRNYGANPTAVVTDFDLYAGVVDFCRHQGICTLSGLAYAEIYFDESPPLWIPRVPGPKRIAAELPPVSPTNSIPGRRIGFTPGNRRLVLALARITSHLECVALKLIQVAATAALHGRQCCVSEVRRLYRESREVLIWGTAAPGWDISSPAAAMLTWVTTPPPFADLSSLERSKVLLRDIGIAVSPGVGFSEYGHTRARLALVKSRRRIRQAVSNMRSLLQRSGAPVEDARTQRAAE